MKKSWRKLRENIPKKVRLSRKYSFDIKWEDDVGKSRNGRPHYGETSFDPREIKLGSHLDDEHAVSTYWHEFLHTFRIYKNMHLTETQVKAFEKKFDVFYEFFLTLHEGSDKIHDEEK